MTSKSILKSLKIITKEIKKINYNLIINHSKKYKFYHAGTHEIKKKRKEIMSELEVEVCDDDLIKKIIKQGGL